MIVGDEKQDEPEPQPRQRRHGARAAAGRREPHALRRLVDQHPQVLQVQQAGQPGRQPRAARVRPALHAGPVTTLDNTCLNIPP